MKKPLTFTGLSLLIFTLSACNLQLTNNTTTEANIGTKNEYTFNNKALTRNYLGKKIQRFLENNGSGLVKELAFQRYKDPDLLTEVIENNPDPETFYEQILNTTEVQERINKDPGFSSFISDLEPAGDPVGEFQVNTFFTGDQNSPKIAVDSAGNFIITYESQIDNNRFGIGAQRFNSQGEKTGTEIVVNSITANNQLRPAIAMNSSGKSVIAFETTNLSFDDSDIFVRLINSNGVPQGTDIRVNQNQSLMDSDPTVAIDQNGNFLVAWMRGAQFSSNYNIYARRFDSNGTPLGNEFIVNTYTPDRQMFPKAEMDYTGNSVITWSSYLQDGDYGEIYAQRYDNTGLANGNEFRVNTTTASDQGIPNIAMNRSNGDFVVNWRSTDQDGSGEGTYAQRFSNTGSMIGGEFRASTMTQSDQHYPIIAMNSSGNFITSWATQDNSGFGFGVYIQRYNSDGTIAATDYRVNTSEVGYIPGIAISENGKFVVAWMRDSFDGSGYGILAKRFRANGTPY
jgi:hypothetical protein